MKLVLSEALTTVLSMAQNPHAQFDEAVAAEGVGVDQRRAGREAVSRATRAFGLVGDGLDGGNGEDHEPRGDREQSPHGTASMASELLTEGTATR